jgi:hypothetical protein
MAAAAADVVPEHLQGPAMPVSKLLVIANTFLVDTTRFLNHFAAKCVPPPVSLAPRSPVRSRGRHRHFLATSLQHGATPVYAERGAGASRDWACACAHALSMRFARSPCAVGHTRAPFSYAAGPSRVAAAAH